MPQKLSHYSSLWQLWNDSLHCGEWTGPRRPIFRSQLPYLQLGPFGHPNHQNRQMDTAVCWWCSYNHHRKRLLRNPWKIEEHHELHRRHVQLGKKPSLEFGIEKFQLLDISRKLTPHQLSPKKKVPLPWHTLVLSNQCIPSKEMAKFLGVIIDNKLDWKEQCTAALAKGQDWLIQFSRLARTIQGINTKYTWQLYLSIAVPYMLYAADIFLTPQQNVGKPTKDSCNNQAIVNKLTSVQRWATIMITGAMKTTATDILKVMANLMLFYLLVNSVVQVSLTQGQKGHVTRVTPSQLT